MAIAPVLKTGVRKDLGVRIPRPPLIVLGVLASLGCSRNLTVEPAPPTVAFKYDAPFCGTALIEKSVDHAVVSTDSMAPGATSRPFVVAAGDHVLGARQLRTINGQQSAIYTWADTTVSLKDNTEVTRVLSLYCS